MELTGPRRQDAVEPECNEDRSRQAVGFRLKRPVGPLRNGKFIRAMSAALFNHASGRKPAVLYG